MHETPEPPKRGPGAPEQDQLAGFLSVVLAALFGGSFLVFLILVTFNIFLGVIAVAGILATVVGLHYLIWGRFHSPEGGSDVQERPADRSPRPGQDQD